MPKTREIQKKQEADFDDSMIQEMESSSSSSPLEQLYQTDDFQLDWNRNLRHHLGLHVVHMRHFNGQTQADVAVAMGTSQGKVARIEAGSENVTVDTIERLAVALDARLQFCLIPKCCNLPEMPDWWSWINNGLDASKTFVFQSATQHFDAQGSSFLGAVWRSTGATVSVEPDTRESIGNEWSPVSLEVY